MKKMMNWVLAAALICGLNVFSSCINDNDDNPVIDNLAEKLIGKWMIYEIDGNTALTNEKEVITFVSPTKAYVSRSRARSHQMDGESSRPAKPEDLPDVEPDTKPDTKRGTPGWKNQDEYDVTIEGNTVTLTSEGRNGSKRSTEYQIISISDSEFACEVIHKAPSDKKAPSSDGDKKRKLKQKMRYEKVTVDYSEAILGLWEGHITSDMGSEFDDGEDHRWEYLDDDTFRFYLQDLDGTWFVNPGQIKSDYFVDGTLLCTRWVIDDEVGDDDKKKDNREWWEIESIENGVMKWKALRANEDGTTYVATFEMTLIPED